MAFNGVTRYKTKYIHPHDGSLDRKGLKPWREVTQAEIDKRHKTRCIHCKYMGGNGKKDPRNISQMYCDYIGITGHRRPYHPEECPLWMEGGGADVQPGKTGHA